MSSEGPRGASRVALLLATAGGVGYAPVASGTFGSLPGLAIAWLLLARFGTLGLLTGFAVVSIAGLWAAGRAARDVGLKDPGIVVVDEVAGQMLTLAFHPPTWPVLACGFFLFRLFDVVKPPPARQAESLPGGSGIMADDWIAGIFANLSLHALAWVFPAWLGTR